MPNKSVIAIVVFAILALPMLNLPINIDAQQITLSVSAKDTGGKFFGPQIVQVIVEGSSIRDSDTSTASLIVKGQSIPLVHLGDSRWYAFFADERTFTRLASATGIPGSSDGDFWVIGPDNKELFFPTLPTAIGHDSATNDPTNPNLDLDGDCPATISGTDSCVEWPYIRLFNFSENDQIAIRYSGQSITLDYVRPSPDDIALSLDREFYPIDAEIIFGLSDYMWNINPIEEDQVHFAFSNGSTRVFYQPSSSLPAESVTNVLTDLRFNSNQMLSLQGKEGIRFENTIGGMSETIMIETSPNSGTFENFDSRADMFAKERNVQFRFDYFNKSIAAGMGKGDAHVDVGKTEPKTGTPPPEVKEEEEQKVKIDPYSISEPKVVDLVGRSISRINVEGPVLIQTTVTNNLEQEQPFTYIVQVKDDNDYTVMLTWIKGNIYALNSFSAGISWTPEEQGNYTIEVFVWESIDEPGALPLAKSLKVSVF
jgi:hypothetical protein